MGHLTFAALMVSLLAGCANITATPSSTGYAEERTGPNTDYPAYYAPSKPPYRESYVVRTPNGAKLIVEESYAPRPSKK